MAQPVGYNSDTTPSGLTEHIDNSRPLVNGQPPQFSKISSTAGMKHLMNSSGSSVSNGPPFAHHSSTPGSLSSHSSRNASPTPPARPIGVSQSMENLSPSAGITNNHFQQGNPASYQPLSGRTNPMIRMESSQSSIMRMGSVPSDLHQQSHTEPSSKSLNPPRLSQNIPLQSISENNQNHSQDPRISTSVDKQHSSLSSSNQPSFNGPANPHTNHVNPFNSLPRTSASGTLPLTTTSQQEHFPNGPSADPKQSVQPASQIAQNPGNVPQNLMSRSGITSQRFQDSFSESSRVSGQPSLSQHSGASSVADSGQIPGPPTSQYANASSTNHAMSNQSYQYSAHHQSASGPNMAGSNRTVSPGMPSADSTGSNPALNTQQSSQPDMPPSSASGPSNIRTFNSGFPPTAFNQPSSRPVASSGPNVSSTNQTVSPGMIPTGPPGFTQQPAYPGMPPTNASGVKPPPVNHQGYQPPSSASGPSTMTSNPTVSPGMPVTSTTLNQPSIQQAFHPGVPPASASGIDLASSNKTDFNRPPNIQQSSHPGMPPRPLPVGHQANTVGGRYPGTPPSSALGTGPLLGSSQMPTSTANQAATTSIPAVRQPTISSEGPAAGPSPQFPGMPPVPGGGQARQYVGGQNLGMPPGSITGGSPLRGDNRIGVQQVPGGNRTLQRPTGQYPGMPPMSASGIPSIPGSNQQYPGMPPTSSSGMQPISGSNQYPGIPPTSSLGISSIPGSNLQYPGIPPKSYSGMPSMPGLPPTSSPGIPPVPGSNQQYPGMPPTSSSRIASMPGSNQQYSGMPHASSAGIQSIPGSNQQYPGMLPANSSGIPPIPGSNQQYAGMQPTSSSGVRPQATGQLRPNMYPGMPPSSQTSSQIRYPTSSGQPQSPSSQSSQPVASGMPPTSQYPGMPPMPAPSAGMPAPPPSSSNAGGAGDPYHPSRRYPQQPGYPVQSQPGVDALTGQMSNMSVTQTGFNKLWGLEYYDLLQTRNILPPEKVEPPKIVLHQEYLDSVNCSPEIFRCTLTKIPESNSLLQKARLPLGILIHPFKDLNHLPVIQCSTIVRCRACRTYINPFVYFVDQKRWKCNLCFRVNELPEEFQYDPVTKTYGCPTRRPEIKSSTMEFIAPSEYMLRPPQPAVYLFLLDVSQLAVESGYLQLVCDILLDEFDKLPGDARAQIGFITFDSTVHFYNLGEGLNQPQQMIVVDTDDIFLPCPDNLLVNLSESRELIKDLLTQLPRKFKTSHDPYSVLGPALQVAYKLMSPTGGRVTVFQSCLPTKGPGALTAREDPSQRAGKEAPHLNPAIDFYKRLALDCSGQQVAVDLFVLNSQYCDLATISGVSRFSGGCIHHFPLFKASNYLQAENFERIFRRYLKRKIGFEAVMRIRCSRGLAIHTFHGNFFVRSTDLLSLPNVNPDAGFGMQVSIEESLSELQNVCFQAALLYTTSKGERRIRVHTLCLPVATTLPDILHSADQQCIVGLLAKMAVDRSLQTSLSDAREAFINVAIDVLSAYRVVQSSGVASGLIAPHNLRLLPLYILALLKYVAFRSGQSTRLDDRVFAMCQMKTLPLTNLIQAIYPDMYPVHCLEEQLVALEDGSSLPQPPRLHLSAEKLDQRGVFLMDTGDHMMLYVGRSVSVDYCTDVFGVPSYSEIPEEMYEVPALETTRSENLRKFIDYLQSEKPYCATLQVIRDDGHFRSKFIERLIEDRTESAFSYYEFLQHLKTNVK